MKKITFVLILMMATITMFGQDITGQWNGVLEVQGMKLRIVFNVSKSGDGYASTMDSPDQGAKGIPVTITTFENPVLKLEITNAGIKFINGTLKLFSKFSVFISSTMYFAI